MLLAQYEFLTVLVNDKNEHESIDWHPSGLSKQLRKRVDCDCRFTKVGNFNSTYYEFLCCPIDYILAGTKKRMAGVIVHCRAQPYFAHDKGFDEAYVITSNTTTTGEADVGPDKWTLSLYRHF